MSTEIGGKAAAIRIHTGTYAGDGTVSHSITGIGFRPRYVKIWRGFDAASNYGEIYERADVFASNLSYNHSSDWPTQRHPVFSDKIISLDADGFTVDDGGADLHPNKLGTIYWFLALG